MPIRKSTAIRSALGAICLGFLVACAATGPAGDVESDATVVSGSRLVDAEAALQAFAKSAHKSEMDAINTEPVLKKHEATLKAICEDFAKNGAF